MACDSLLNLLRSRTNQHGVIENHKKFIKDVQSQVDLEDCKQAWALALATWLQESWNIPGGSVLQRWLCWRDLMRAGYQSEEQTENSFVDFVTDDGAIPANRLRDWPMGLDPSVRRQLLDNRDGPSENSNNYNNLESLNNARSRNDRNTSISSVRLRSGFNGQALREGRQAVRVWTVDSEKIQDYLRTGVNTRGAAQKCMDILQHMDRHAPRVPKQPPGQMQPWGCDGRVSKDRRDS